MRFRRTSLTGSFQLHLPSEHFKQEHGPEDITRGQNEEGSPLEIDAQTQEHMEIEAPKSIQELSAKCWGTLL
ncbi:hypothetical protein I79_005647 [Cricetulus griseus]|uniref:Uncharacterized protein n=1 Tax=Cricetulus griseus TaxID=10029 RepID=G3H5R1_CRIGR|nr:hypothetical protein I79_005647 [Cricetulus griseus]